MLPWMWWAYAGIVVTAVAGGFFVFRNGVAEQDEMRAARESQQKKYSG